MDSADSCTMAGSGESEYLTSPATASEPAPTSFSQSSLYYSGCRESLVESRESGRCTDIDQQIENSKSHWSQLTDYSDSDSGEVAEVSNVEVFKALQKHPTWGAFFHRFNRRSGRSLVVGEKFAEGGQAELYHAQVTWSSPLRNEWDLKHGREWALKVFKEGTFLRHLKSQWPEGLFELGLERWQVLNKLGEKRSGRNYCDVYCGTLLDDGRFAFLLEKEDGDLRSLIDDYMLKYGHGCGPFSKELAEKIMYRIALGMDSLHRRNIMHRDLKASNVLVSQYGSDEHRYCVFVADFESSVEVIGTGFWRAPEILQACKDGNVSHSPKLLTKAADVFSFGMTCFEVLTGKFPFKGHPWSDYDLVLNGHQLEVPEYVDDWAHRLLSWCWHPNPTDRPSFRDILTFLADSSPTCRRIEKYRRKNYSLENKGL